MARVTVKAISAAIEAATGLKGIKIYVDRKYGVCHFYSDDDRNINSESVYVMRLSDLSINHWVETFIGMNTGLLND